MTRNVGDLHLHRFRKLYLKEIVQEGVRACCCLAPGHPGDERRNEATMFIRSEATSFKGCRPVSGSTFGLFNGG